MKQYAPKALVLCIYAHSSRWKKSRLSFIVCILTLGLELACLNSIAQYTKVMDFEKNATGTDPEGSFLFDGEFLYATTRNGGLNDMGTVFKIKRDGTGYTRLLDFDGTTNGRVAINSLISDGTFLYGTTSLGGSHDQGTIFKIKKDGTAYSKLLDFDGPTTGYYAESTLFYDGSFLYGTLVYGGSNGLGTLFKIGTDGKGFVTLLNFAGTINGSNPYSSLITDGTVLYGTTRQGGANDLGTVYKIKPDGSGYVNLLNFSGAANGGEPYGDLFYDGTFLYGTTLSGGVNNIGTIYKIKPDGSGYSKLLDFSGAANGASPTGSLISDGVFLYGMTYAGGAGDFGTIFKIKTDGTDFNKLTEFNDITGIWPLGSLITDGVFLYGMTSDTFFKYSLAGELMITAVPLTTEVEGKIILDIVPLITTTATLNVSSIKIVSPPASGSMATIVNGVLTIDYKAITFSGAESITVEACNTDGACIQQAFNIEVVGDIIIYNAISPNGDNKNDFFLLQFIEVLNDTKQNQVTILNRWGDVVFKTDNYNNQDRAFKGISKNGEELPTGTYYYKINFTSGKDSKTGFLYLKR